MIEMLSKKALDTDVARSRALRALFALATVFDCSEFIDVGPPRGSTLSLDSQAFS